MVHTPVLLCVFVVCLVCFVESAYFVSKTGNITLDGLPNEWNKINALHPITDDQGKTVCSTIKQTQSTPKP